MATPSSSPASEFFIKFSILLSFRFFISSSGTDSAKPRKNRIATLRLNNFRDFIFCHIVDVNIFYDFFYKNTPSL